MTNATSFDFERSRRRIPQLTRATRVLAKLTDAEAILRAAAKGASDLLETDRAVALFDDGEGMLQALYDRNEGPEPRLDRVDEGLDERLGGRLEELFDGPFLATPMTAENKAVGVLAVASRPNRDFYDEDQWMLAALADQASAALFQAASRERDRRDLEERIESVFDDPEQRQLAMSAMAHDLRSPLLNIKMGLDLLAKKCEKTDAKVGDIIESMRAARNHLTSVAENLIETIRFRVGVAEVHCEMIPVLNVIQDSGAVLSYEAQARKQRIEPPDESEVGNPMAWGDAKRLRQVVVNLLDNAMKYSPKDSVIVVGVSQPDPNACELAISVTDQGPGVADDQKEAVFQPFYRDVGAKGIGKQGIGLGLAISRELVRKMGGDIDIVDAPDGGATFRVRLLTREP